MKKLPIGIQNIREIIEEGYVYVDKTSFAHRLISTGKHYFLSRPRRFGKSLFLDTLDHILRGNKALFKGCSIYRTDYDWQPYPILRFDLYTVPCKKVSEFEEGLKRAVHDLAQLHGVTVDLPTPQEGLKKLVEQLRAKHQQPVVVLVDEYDKPLITNLERPQVAKGNRETLREFFGMLKSLDSLLKFTFTTGVSRFSKVSLFTGPNNLDDITMDAAYATMMGYTEAELKSTFAAHIQHIAQVQRTTPAEVLATIKHWYNGYRFTKAVEHVYNPFSTLEYMSEYDPKSYWYDTGTPAFLLQHIQQQPRELLPLSGVEVTSSDLTTTSTIETIELETLMLQTGYLTIQDWEYDEDLEESVYTLNFPNQEVHKAFFSSLLRELTHTKVPSVTRAAMQLQQALGDLQIEAFIRTLNIHFAKISYETTKRVPEGFYQAVFFTFLEVSGLRTQLEEGTSRGRIDLVTQLPTRTIIFELKVDQSAQAAVDQIKDQRYADKYLQQGKEIVILGISFSTATRDIGEWQGGLYDAQGQLIRTLREGTSSRQ